MPPLVPQVVANRLEELDDLPIVRVLLERRREEVLDRERRHLLIQALDRLLRLSLQAPHGEHRVLDLALERLRPRLNVRPLLLRQRLERLVGDRRVVDQRRRNDAPWRHLQLEPGLRRLLAQRLQLLPPALLDLLAQLVPLPHVRVRLERRRQFLNRALDRLLDGGGKHAPLAGW
jgi:hypothetical protein